MATTIKMPQLGESVTEGTIERWLVKEGDTVEQYDPLFEVVTDKVNAEVPAEIAGTITKIMVPDGETVAVGTPLAEIDAEGGAAAAEAPAAEPVAAAAPAVEETPAEAPAPPEATADARHGGRRGAGAGPGRRRGCSRHPSHRQSPSAAAPAPQPAAAVQAPAATPETPSSDGNGAAPHDAGGPPARAGARHRHRPALRQRSRRARDPRRRPGLHRQGARRPGERSAGTGCRPRGRRSAAPAPAAAPAEAAPAPRPAPPSVPSPAGGDVELPLSQMRKGIAKKMTQVKQTVPHAYTVVEVDMTNVVKWREANNMAFKAREGASLSYVAVVVKAVTETLRKHPTLNSQFADDKIILKQAMNIGIAVAVDNGLIVPVIANADQLSISGVNARIRDISSRAHAGKLRLDELQGGTFTVNNTGWFGSVISMPIINAPEVAILSMEAIVKRPRVIEVDGSDVIAIRHMMNMTCSFDHRVLDGAQVGFFLADVRSFLEEWDANTSIG